jgi:signal peptidase I
MVEKLSYRFRDPERGELAVFRRELPPEEERDVAFVMRVAGLPGETVRIVPPHIVVNGKPLKHPGVFARISSGQGSYKGYVLARPSAGYRNLLLEPTDEIVLGEGEYFVVGDHSKLSADSRYWGAVRRENFFGRVTRILWPPDRIGQSMGPE